MMFLRFLFCLGFGLAGVCIFMMTLMDTLFVDWDVFAAVRKWFGGASRRQQRRYVHIEKTLKNKKKNAFETEFLGGGDTRAPVLPEALALTHRG